MNGPDTTERVHTSKVRAYIELTKPRIIELLLITTVPAMVVAERGWPGWWLVAVVLAGGTLSAGGANVINQVYDRDIDRIMKRTAGRPIPTDRISPKAATWFGVVLGVAGFAILTVGSTLLAGLLSLAAFGFYVLVYTMVLKRTTTQNIVIGGAAGAVPALIGWAAVTGDLSVAPWLMFAMILFWTPPHFWALSLKYEEDYRLAKIPMLPVIAGDESTFKEIIWYSVMTVGVSLMLVPTASLSWVYAGAAGVLGMVLIFGSIRLRSDRARAMRYFGLTNLYLAGVFIAMMADSLVNGLDSGAPVVWLIAATFLVLVGAVGIIVTEAASNMRAPGVSRTRHATEIGVTMAFVAGLTAVVWIDASQRLLFTNL